MWDSVDIDDEACPQNLPKICRTIDVHSTKGSKVSKPTRGCYCWGRWFQSIHSLGSRFGWVASACDRGTRCKSPMRFMSNRYDASRRGATEWVHCRSAEVVVQNKGNTSEMIGNKYKLSTQSTSERVSSPPQKCRM